MPSERLRRVNEEIRTIVAERVLELKDPRIGFVTITDVDTTADFSQAEVFYTVYDEETAEQTAEGLASATPLLRREVGNRLRIRRTPDLHFTHDPAPAQGRHIEQLLRRIREDED
jgi:ribosome-binding factor A